MPDTRPSTTSLVPPEKGPKKSTLLILILIFAGGTLAVYEFVLSEPEETRTAVEEPPERIERQIAFTTAEPEPPPLPETAAPPEDAGATKTKNRGGGGGCAGEINQAAVGAFARSHMGPLRSCYERRLKVNNLLQGRIVLKMTVGSTGAVSRTSVVQNTIHDREVTACVQQAVGRWRLPAPTGGCVHVEYPFSFSPRP